MSSQSDNKCHLRRRAVDALAAMAWRRLADRDDSGQTIVIVVILLALLTALAPVMAGQISRDTPLLISTTNKHAALAAAEAGIQWYRDNLGTYSTYFNYSATNLPPGGDAALSGYCGAGQPSTCDLAGTAPPEAFHYTPNLTQGCAVAVTGSTCTVNVTVTGRAGAPGNYSYVYAEASFAADSVLGDAYYSNFEVLDPNSLTIQGITVSSSNGPAQAETTDNISYSYVNSAGTTVNVPPESIWQAICQYDTYQPNTFIDSLDDISAGGGNGYYRTAWPLYGPYQVSNGFTFQTNGQGVVVSSGGTTTYTVPAMPCDTPYDFVTGEAFDGPVYSNDQIHVCGSPTFNGAPVSLLSGAPDDPYVYDVPGSVQVGSQHYPEGYTTDQVNCGNGTASPMLAHGVVIGQNQSLPSLNTQLAQYGTPGISGGVSSPPAGTAFGCTYTGPTMIELVTVSNGTTYMDVWSPLSSAPVTTPTCSGGGSGFSVTIPFIEHIALPADGVVYVQDYVPPSGSTVPTINDGSAPCFNPYQVSQPADSAQCVEGDTYVEGELHGQLTIASSANIIITRDLTYNCVDFAGSAVVTNPDTVSGCTTENSPDMLGLSAKYDVLVAHNDPTDQVTQSDQDCLANFGDGTGTPVNTPTSSMLSGNPYNGQQVNSVKVTSGSATVTLGGSGGSFASDGIVAGSDVNVSGGGIPAGTTVTAVNGSSLTLSANATAPSSGERITFTDKGLTNNPAAVWPTLCDTIGSSGSYVDAAIFALNGSFGVQNWDDTPFDGYVNLNGTDLSEYRGPFGVSGGNGSGVDGYEKKISFDQRLSFMSPPYVLSGSVPLWQLDNYVECPTSSCPALG
jgi:hypothetical protein